MLICVYICFICLCIIPSLSRTEMKRYQSRSIIKIKDWQEYHFVWLVKVSWCTGCERNRPILRSSRLPWALWWRVPCSYLSQAFCILWLRFRSLPRTQMVPSSGDGCRSIGRFRRAARYMWKSLSYNIRLAVHQSAAVTHTQAFRPRFPLSWCLVQRAQCVPWFACGG